jgi:hypothetical protein
MLDLGQGRVSRHGRRPEPADDRSRWRPTRRQVLWAAAAVAAVVAAVVVWSVVAALIAKSRLETVRADLESLRSGQLGDRTALARHLSADLRRAKSAQDVLSQSGPVVAAAVPVLGRSIDAEARVADAVVPTLRAGRTLLHATRGLGAGGRIDLDRLRSVEHRLTTAADGMRGPLHRLDDVDVGLTPPPVQHAVWQAQRQLGSVRDALVTGTAAVQALGGMLGANGPRHVLICLENNAELRGTGGLISVFATGRTNDGKLTLGHFRDVEDVADLAHAAKRVKAPPAFRHDYGQFLADTTLWKNTNMTPSVPDAAAVLSHVAAATTRKKPDAVLLIDVPAMASIVSETGPITIDGRQVTGDELEHDVLVGAYRRAGGSDQASQDARRHELERAANVAFRRLRHGSPSVGTIRALADAAAGRHLALWSARPDEERQLRQAGLAGAVDPRGADLAMVTAQNLGDSPEHGNKLDYYARRRLSVDVAVGEHRATVTEQLSITNGAHRGLGPYVAGPEHPGRLRELVGMAIGARATVMSFTQDGAPARRAAEHHEHGSVRIVTPVTLARGQTARWRLRYRVPLDDGIYRLRLLAQPLAKPATLHLTVHGVDGKPLEDASGRPARAQVLHYRGPWDTSRSTAVRRRHGSGLSAVINFLRSPVHVG